MQHIAIYSHQKQYLLPTRAPPVAHWYRLLTAYSGRKWLVVQANVLYVVRRTDRRERRGDKDAHGNKCRGFG